MNYQRLSSCTLLIAALGACAVTYDYTKGGNETLNSDLQECRSAAEQRTGNRQANEAISSCMERKGYAVTKKDYGRYF